MATIRLTQRQKFPGETQAVDEVLGLKNLRIERFPFDSYIFKEQPDAHMVAVAEVHRGRLDEAKAFVGGSVRGHGDFRKLLEDRQFVNSIAGKVERLAMAEELSLVEQAFV